MEEVEELLLGDRGESAAAPPPAVFGERPVWLRPLAAGGRHLLAPPPRAHRGTPRCGTRSPSPAVLRPVSNDEFPPDLMQTLLHEARAISQKAMALAARNAKKMSTPEPAELAELADLARRLEDVGARERRCRAAAASRGEEPRPAPPAAFAGAAWDLAALWQRYAAAPAAEAACAAFARLERGGREAGGVEPGAAGDAAPVRRASLERCSSDSAAQAPGAAAGVTAEMEREYRLFNAALQGLDFCGEGLEGPPAVGDVPGGWLSQAPSDGGAGGPSVGPAAAVVRAEPGAGGRKDMAARPGEPSWRETRRLSSAERREVSLAAAWDGGERGARGGGRGVRGSLVGGSAEPDERVGEFWGDERVPESGGGAFTGGGAAIGGAFLGEGAAPGQGAFSGGGAFRFELVDDGDDCAAAGGGEAGAAGGLAAPLRSATLFPVFDTSLEAAMRQSREAELSEVQRSLAALQKLTLQLHALSQESGEQLLQVEGWGGAAAAAGVRANRQLALANRGRSRWWAAQGTGAGAVGGGLLGLALGPLGAVAGAGVGGAVAGFLGRQATELHRAKMDRILARLEARGGGGEHGRTATD